jgi:hypothetical protein
MASAAGAGAGAKRPNGSGSKRSAVAKSAASRAAKVARTKRDGSDSKAPPRRRRLTKREREEREQQERDRLDKEYEEKFFAERKALAAKAEWDNHHPYNDNIKGLWWVEVQSLVNTVPTHVPRELCELILCYATPAHYDHMRWEASFSVPRPFESYERMYAPLLALREAHNAACAATEVERRSLWFLLNCPNGPLLHFQESNRIRDEFEAKRKGHYGIPQLSGKTHFYVAVRKQAIVCDEDPFEPIIRPTDACVRIELDAPILSVIMDTHKNGMLERYSTTGSMERNIDCYLGDDDMRMRTSVLVADPDADPPRATDYFLVVVRS